MLTKKQLLHLKLLSKRDLNPRVQRAMLLDKDVVDGVCECALNTIKGTVPLENSQKKKLSKYKKLLRYLATKKASTKRKREILIQHGKGILPFLIPAAITLFKTLYNVA